MLCPRCGKNVGDKQSLCDECQVKKQAESSPSAEGPGELHKETVILSSSDSAAVGERNEAKVLGIRGERFGRRGTEEIIQIIFHPACLVIIGAVGLVLLFVVISFALKSKPSSRGDVAQKEEQHIQSSSASAGSNSKTVEPAIIELGRPDAAPAAENETQENTNAPFSKSQIGSLIDKESVRRVHQQLKQIREEQNRNKNVDSPAPLDDR